MLIFYAFKEHIPTIKKKKKDRVDFRLAKVKEMMTVMKRERQRYERDAMKHS
jgi:hypothetical protein